MEAAGLVAWNDRATHAFNGPGGLDVGFVAAMSFLILDMQSPQRYSSQLHLATFASHRLGNIHTMLI